MTPEGQWFSPDVLSNHAYHAMDGISSSNIKQLDRSAAHYQESQKAQKSGNQEQTPAQLLGTQTHMAVFEPDLYAKTVIVCQKFDGRTNAGKAAKLAFEAELPAGCQMITEENAAHVAGMSAAVRAVVDLDGCEAEMSGVYPLTRYPGIMAKIRPDAMMPRIMYDLKTCKDASEREFYFSVKRYGYHISSTWYEDIAFAMGREFDRFIWIAVESKPPYAVAQYEPGETMRISARDAIERSLDRYARCERESVWPGYSSGVIPIDFPAEG